MTDSWLDRGWLAFGRVVQGRDVCWDFLESATSTLHLCYDLRTGTLYCALTIGLEEELRMLMEDDDDA